MAADAPPIEVSAPLRIEGVTRMPRGEVRVDSPNRPMLIGKVAEDKDDVRLNQTAAPGV
ncbi:hypothetical protein BH23PLA1_BH23PLA1_01020 [soil metagenome]